MSTATKRPLLTVAIAALLLLPALPSVASGYRLFDRNHLEDIALRSEVVGDIALAPHGLIASPAMHTAPIRVAVEFGALAALAWLWLVARAAWVTRRTPVAWTVAAMAMISLQDYYFVLGMLLPLWWVLVNAQKSRPGNILSRLVR
jgi:hypothetical protein